MFIQPTANLQYQSNLHMNRQIVNAFRRFHHRFGNGRVRVDGLRKRFGGGFVRHSDAGFGKQFGGVRSDDVNAENLVVFFLRDDFDEAVGFA